MLAVDAIGIVVVEAERSLAPREGVCGDGLCARLRRDSCAFDRRLEIESSLPPPSPCLLDASDAVLNCSTQNLEYWHVEAGSLEAQHTLHCKVRPVTLALGPFGRQACPGDRRPAGRLPDAVLGDGQALSQVM